MTHRLLDLFCGGGGASMGYAEAGFEVSGVDIVHQANYPFQFYQDDALTFDLEGWHYVHASPPCQKWTAYRRRGDGVGDSYPDLIAATRARLQGKRYVIENLPKTPLLNPITLCGSSFGLNVRRHRWFESNVPLKGLPCEHSWQTPRYTPASNRTNLRSTVEIGVWRIPLEIQQQAMEIDWLPLPELSEAIPPAYTQFIGRQLLTHD